MARSLSAIAELLDGMADSMVDVAGLLMDREDLQDKAAKLHDADGKPIDLKELARDIRAHEAALTPPTT
jgi:hypothetical protein